MKKYLALLIVVLLASTLDAQKISLNELFAICSFSQWDEANEYLLKRGWEYHESSKGDDYHYSTITWSFNKEDNSDKAQSWFYLYTYNGAPNKIVFSFLDKQSFNTFKTAVTKEGLKLIESNIGDNEIETNYSNTNFFVKIVTSKVDKESFGRDNSMAGYSVEVIKKSGIYDQDNGKKIDYYANGTVKAEYSLAKGKIDGILKVYYESGALKKTGFFVNGQGNGKFVEWDEQGIVTSEYYMIKGELNGILTIYKDGLKEKEISKRNGINNGKYVSYQYTDGGQLYALESGEYIDNKKNGKWVVSLISNGEEEVVEYTTFINDVKNGEFKVYVNSDTLEIGTYKNGILNGYYKRKVKIDGVRSDNQATKISLWWLDCEGYFVDGFKEGKWIYYNTSFKEEEGEYLHGEKNGKWLEYVLFGNHAKEVLKETNYLLGKEHGNIKRFFDTYSVKDSIVLNGIRSETIINTPIYELYSYDNGKLEGDYVLRDSSGVLLRKGVFKEDKKSGFWTESIGMDPVTKTKVIYHSGVYHNDEREGIWNSYIDSNTVIAKESFKNGELDGTVVFYYRSNNKPHKVYQFKSGQLVSLEKYDTLGVIRNRFEINFIKGSLVSCIYTKYKDGVANAQGYEFVRESEDASFYNLDNEFIKNIGNKDKEVKGVFYQNESLKSKIAENPQRDAFITNPISYSNLQSELVQTKPSSWKKEGWSEVFEIDSKRKITYGDYKNGNKSGNWRFFYYDNGIFIDQEFIDGNGGVERYFSISSGSAFTGLFEFFDADNGQIREVKVSKGLREGQTKVFDKGRNLLQVEKYKKGVLVNPKQ